MNTNHWYNMVNHIQKYINNIYCISSIADCSYSHAFFYANKATLASFFTGERWSVGCGKRTADIRQLLLQHRLPLSQVTKEAKEAKRQNRLVIHITTSRGRRTLLRRRPEDDEGTQLGREWNRTFIECETRAYIGVVDSRIRHIRRLPGDLAVAQYRNDPKPRGSARHESARITKHNN